MEKFKIINENVLLTELKKQYPYFFEEGKLNVEKMKEMIGEITKEKESFSFNWNGKQHATQEGLKPSISTLIPLKDKSIDWDNTKNIYIEGDNLEVLKTIKKTFSNSIKMIYIDPPYNTGKDFVYSDNFVQNMVDYQELTKQQYRVNPESSGRFHSNWLSMIYSRLIVARDLLMSEGIIFISIDDNEMSNLSMICNEVFGEENFVAKIIIEGTPKNDPLIVSTAHEYCLVYCKNIEEAKKCNWGVSNKIYSDLLNIFENNKPNYKKIQVLLQEYYQNNDLKDDNISNYKYADERGVYRTGPIDDPQGGGSRDIRFNPITKEALVTPNSGWRCNIDTWNDWISNGLVAFPEDNTKLCSKKTYIKRDQLDLLRSVYKMQTRKDTDMLKNVFGKKVFSFPKPVDLISSFIDSSIKEDDYVLDFFSGSATTAHACMKINAERGNSKVHYILVQLQEDLNENLLNASGNREKTTVKNAIEYCKEHNLPEDITSIGEERIRIFSKKYKNDGIFSDDIDFGFKVFKLDSTNIVPWDSSIKLNEEGLMGMIDVIKEGRTNLDVAYEIMLKYGVFNMPLKEITINGKTMFSVGEDYMIICLDNQTTLSDVEEIGKLKPHCVVFKDSGFKDDNVKLNGVKTLQTYGVQDIKSL